MLKLMNTVVVLMTLCGGFNLCYGDQLKCDLRNVDFNVKDNSQYNGLYSCKVTSLDNSNIIDGFTGVHKTNKNVSDVKAIWIHHTNTKLIPDDIGQLFNLICFFISDSQLVEIKADNFLGMQKLEVLNLRNNSLTSVSSNTFSFLPKLKFIELNRNQLSEIPSGLFTNNLNLEQIHLYGNKIKFLGTGVFDELTKLRTVDLQANVCEINQLFKGTFRIGKLKNKMNSKCKNPNDPQEIIFKLKHQNEELTKDVKDLKKEKDALMIEMDNKTTTLTSELFICKANQQKSMEFSLICDFKMTNGGQYTCETRDLTIHHKDVKLNEVIGTHLKSKSNQNVTELIIVKSSMFYWSNDIFTKFPALQILKIQNAQLNEFKKGDFSSASELRFLVVNGNNIKPLGEDVFHGTEENLTEINLNSNQIEKISAGTFRGLKQLKVLSLKDNLITEIPLGSFKDIVMLEILILTGNKIKFLDGKMLEFNKRLMSLAVDQNELGEIGEEILDHSKMLKDVNLEGNYCIDERTGTDDDDTDGRTLNDLNFVIRNCCKNPEEALNVYNCGQSGSED